MLVLARQTGEKIVIGHDVKVTVISAECNRCRHRIGKVRIGVEAPREVPVHREEVFEAIKESTRTAPPDCGS